MRRMGIIVLSVVMLCGAFGASIAVAQEATPAAGGDHPVVGSWVLDTEPENPTNAPTLAVFSADGVYFQVEPAGEVGTGTQVGVGSWETTGGTTADMTFLIIGSDGFMLTIRASLDAADGQSLTGTYTTEFVDPDGVSTGEVGPGEVEGTRITVEPQGEPVGSFEDIFGAPEATPAG